jgi:fibronectin-binding autotransporter adhesin
MRNTSFLRILTLCLAGLATTQIALANTQQWIGIGGVSASTNWSDNANWQQTGTGGAGPNGNDVIIGDQGGTNAAGIVTSVVDANGLNPFSMTISNGFTAARAISTILVPSGVNVTNSTSFIVGEVNIAANNWAFTNFWIGAGALVQNGTTMTVDNSSSTASAGTLCALDMSGLSNFVATGITTLNIAGSGSEGRGVGKLTLAQSNAITATNITMNTASGNAASFGGTLNLGLTTNIINVTTFVLGQTKGNSGVVQFPGSTGGLRIRGVSGADSDRAVTLTLGDRNNTGSGTTSGSLLVAGHPVDIKATTITIGQDRSGSGSSTHAGSGTVAFDTGTIDASTINMAVSTSSGTASSATGTILVGGNGTVNGTLVIGSGGLSLGNKSGGSTGATATLTVSNGTVNASGNIGKSNTGAVGTVVTTNATLIMASGTSLGTLAVPVDTFGITNSTLSLAVSSTLTNISVGTFNLGGSTNNFTITSLPAIGSYPSQFALIKYSTMNVAQPDGIMTLLGVSSLPGTYSGYVSNSATGKIVWLVITNGPTPPPASKAVVWDGEVSGAWDTTTTNWTSGGILTNYNNVTATTFGDTVTFDDTLLGTTNVNLTQTLSPGSILVNAATNYYFTGSGKISGAISLTKQNTGTLTFANTAANDFSGAITLTAGTLAYDQTVNATVANAISGPGSLVKNNNNTLTLSGASPFSGSITVNGGTLRLASISTGTGTTTVNTGATLVHSGGFYTNAEVLSGTTISAGLGTAANSTNMTSLTVNGTNTLQTSDPQNIAGASFNVYAAGVMHGSGTLIVQNAANITSPDGNQGFRIVGTGASDFTGTIIYTNNSKGEIATAGTTPFTPVGNGKIVIVAGAYDGGQAVTAPATGGYVEFNIRNSGGTTTIPTDFAISGTGAAVINGLGTGNGAVATLGNLTIGNGQELIGYRSSGSTTNAVAFPTVSLTGGTATFSPRSTTFGSATQAGTDFILTNVSETAQSSITMAGRNRVDGSAGLTIAGTDAHTGNTIINSGSIALTGSATMANAANIIVANGATFDVAGLSSAFALGSGQTLSNSSSTAVLKGAAGTGSGTVSLTYASGTPSFNVTNGALTLSASTTFKVNNTGAALARGSYKIVSAGAGGSVAGTLPSVTLGGNGVANGTTPTLGITSSELYLVVPDAPPVIAHIVTNSTTAGISWKIAISDLTNAAVLSDPDNDPVLFNAVSPASNLGTNVSSDSTFIYYNGPVTAEDFFTYTVSDGTLMTTGTVYLEPVAGAPAPATGNQVVFDGNGVPTVTFAGIPGRTNVTQASTNLTDWTAISTNVAGTNGLWQVIDTDATNYQNRFYRSYQPYP